MAGEWPEIGRSVGDQLGGEGVRHELLRNLAVPVAVRTDRRGQDGEIFFN